MFSGWLIKIGAVLTVCLVLGSIVSFIYAWNDPAPTDALSAVTRYLHYRWFAFFAVSAFSIGAATVKLHRKQQYHL
ncbi:hypothetical protein KW429_11275 [Vibrio fluvialis]|nr:hypothetical protein [Vibrio fluvialis]